VGHRGGRERRAGAGPAPADRRGDRVRHQPAMDGGARGGAGARGRRGAEPWSRTRAAARRAWPRLIAHTASCRRQPCDRQGTASRSCQGRAPWHGPCSVADPCSPYRSCRPRDKEGTNDDGARRRRRHGYSRDDPRGPGDGRLSGGAGGGRRELAHRARRATAPDPARHQHARYGWAGGEPSPTPTRPLRIFPSWSCPVTSRAARSRWICRTTTAWPNPSHWTTCWKPSDVGWRASLDYS